MNVDTRIDKLLAKRGICGHTAAHRFISDFKAYLCYYEKITGGDASHTLSLLENNDNLISSDILYTNFRVTFDDLIPTVLRENAIFPLLFKILLDNKGKGVGAGELVLPLIIAGYSFSNESDGILENSDKIEIKKNGSSLKPVKTGLTNKGLVDTLNNKHFKGTVPGMKSKKKFDAHIATVTNPKVYADYFKDLYVGCDTAELAKEVLSCYTDPTAFNNTVGKFALKNYKRVDGWTTIVFIDEERETVVNITDVENIDGLGLKFTPKFKRGGDTQAIADGYVNVRI